MPDHLRPKGALYLAEGNDWKDFYSNEFESSPPHKFEYEFSINTTQLLMIRDKSEADAFASMYGSLKNDIVQIDWEKVRRVNPMCCGLYIKPMAAFELVSDSIDDADSDDAASDDADIDEVMRKYMWYMVDIPQVMLWSARCIRTVREVQYRVLHFR